MDKLLEFVRNAGSTRLVALCVGGAAAIAVLAGVFFALSRPKMDLLYADLQDTDAASIVAALEEMEAPMRLSADGRAVYAPRDRIARLRMHLAEKGLPAGGSVGYEIFDQKSSLGLTSFMQDMTHLRALEGELSRTIQTLSDVAGARVHLVLAARDPFSREAAPPSASVVVRMRGAMTLDARSASAIRHLVASAVPRLSPSGVSVLDARLGAVFAEEAGALGGAASVEGLRRDIETRLSAAVESVLTPHLGPGRVRVRVAADLATAREVRREKRYDPRETALRSRQTIDETERARENADEDPVTVEQNLPEADVDADVSARSQSETERTEQVVNYEVSSVSREQVIEPGDIERLSVSVVVDHARTTDAEGTSVTRAHTPEEIEQFSNLVKSAVGFSPARGDVVTIESLPFADVRGEVPSFEAGNIGQVLARNIDSIARAGALLALGCLLIFAVIRPLIDKAAPPLKEARDAESTPLEPVGQLGAQVADQEGGAALEEGGGEGERLALPKRSMDETLNQMLEIRDVDGKVRASSVHKLGQITDQYPDEVVAILRNWIYEDAA